MSGNKPNKRKTQAAGETVANKKIKIETDMDAAETPLFNGDCLRNILRYLCIEDLANVAQTNSTLKEIADTIFTTDHASTIKINYESIERLRLVFQQFGHLATTADINMNGSNGRQSHDDSDDDSEDEDPFHIDGNKVLGVIGQFCGSNLTDLKLCGMQIDLSSAEYSTENLSGVKRVLLRLNKFALVRSCVKGIFRWMQSLEELHIHSCCFLDEMPAPVKLPRLKIVKIGSCVGWPMIVGRCFIEFLRLNPSIETIEYHFIALPDGYLKAICSLPKLLHLDLMVFDYDASVFPALASARKLKKLVVHTKRSDRRRFSNFQKSLPTGCECIIDPID